MTFAETLSRPLLAFFFQQLLISEPGRRYPYGARTKANSPEVLDSQPFSEVSLDAYPPVHRPNGRGTGGRFAAGNGGGPGNPFGKRTAALRAMLLEALTDDDLQAVVGKLVEMAKGGELAAIRELFDRTLGKPAQTEVLESVEALEQALLNRNNGNEHSFADWAIGASN